MSPTSSVNNQLVAFGDIDGVNSQPVAFGDTDSVNNCYAFTYAHLMHASTTGYVQWPVHGIFSIISQLFLNYLPFLSYFSLNSYVDI